ncbi:hypothetical protein GH714_023266 [Hevea brasiliensis]|uniref:Protein kinase domain-containing protein n=1 Tax=Hevea brasiliensis TaxID=3981 RepID=A0A6A6LMQ7_HEVBR|nr:hypothetical protein GH714_023266 [Hevea brasiliensis]
MLDILAHIVGDDQMNGGNDDPSDLDKNMSVPVSSIIGQCLEGLSLWTLNPNTSVVDCMEVLSKGIHLALVPLNSLMENISGVELVESGPIYRMLTQMDMLNPTITSQLHDIISRSVREIGAINENVYAITGGTKVNDANKCVMATMLNAVPIVVASNSLEEDSKQIINVPDIDPHIFVYIYDLHLQILMTLTVQGKGKKLMGTFSATDLRGCHLSALQTWLPLSALEFTEKPENILDSPSHERLSRLKIADLGLAKELGEYDSGKFYTFRGTPLYTSPESVGLAKISSALDIWSLGCVVIEMITREPPCKELGIQYLIIPLAFENRSPEIPESVTKKGKDFLNMCCMRPHCERWIADMLLNHPFIVDEELTSPVDHPLKELPQTSPSILSSSSYDSPG